MSEPVLLAAVWTLGCADGIAHGVAGHDGLAVVSCLAALAGLLLLLCPEETA